MKDLPIVFLPGGSLDDYLGEGGNFLPTEVIIINHPAGYKKIKKAIEEDAKNRRIFEIGGTPERT